jgi:transcription initiation factor IIE alpha subunit
MELTKENILNLLRTNDKAIGRALVVLYNNQTFDEKEHQDVKYHNNKGFRPLH